MRTLKDEVKKVRKEVRDLVDLAKDYKYDSSLYYNRLGDLQRNAERAIEQTTYITEIDVNNLQSELSELRAELLTSIEKAASTIQDGHEKIARAIESSSGDAVAAAFLSGFLKLIGSALQGHIIADSIRDHATITLLGTIKEELNKDHKSATKPQSGTNLFLAKRQAVLSAIYFLQNSKPYLTFKYIIDRISDKEHGFLDVMEARILISNLISEGVLEKYQYGRVNAIRLNNSNPEVISFIKKLKNHATKDK